MRKPYVVLQHVKEDDLGILEEVFSERGELYDTLYVEDDWVSKALETPLLVVLGGPMAVGQEELYPFLAQEILVLQERIAQQMPTLGICLGSQLIAKAAGAAVYPQGYHESGWSPLELTEHGMKSCLKELQNSSVFHWHLETFGLPDGANLLASTPLCKNQAFSLGNNILGLQFHIEANQKKISVFAPQFNTIKEAEKRAKRALHMWLDSIKS